jgi:hypothetical protein
VAGGRAGAPPKISWEPLEHGLGITDPDAPPPAPLLALAFAEMWLGRGVPDESATVAVVGLGVDAPDGLVAAVRAEPAHPPRVEVQWSVEARQPGDGGLICCRLTAAGVRVHRIDLLIAATDSIVAICASASALAVSTADDLDLDRAAGALSRHLLLVPNDTEFWAQLTGVDFGDPLNLE